MDVKYKGCKCPEGFYGETIVTEDNDYNNGRSSIYFHCMKCGIDWLVLDAQLEYPIAKYIKSRKEMQMIAKKYLVKKELNITISAEVIAPSKKVASDIYNLLMVTNPDSLIKDTTQTHSCEEIKPMVKKKVVKKTSIKKKLTKKKRK